jgi:streptogramin lyase
MTRLQQASLASWALAGSVIVWAQAGTEPVNTAPNPYATVSNFFELPAGRTWGSTSAVEVDRDGKSVWVAERCGANSCVDPATSQIRDIPTVFLFNEHGAVVRSFGNGLLTFPHGSHVDRDGNIWFTDGQDNRPRPAAGAPPPPAAAAQAPHPQATKGHQIFKFSPTGQLLLTLGKPAGALPTGNANAEEFFFQPNDALVAPNGDIFVSQGHGVPVDRLFKFDKTGKFIKAWGKRGTAPGEFDQPHALAMDSKGRLFVGDRNNNRIQIFDQDGKFLEEHRQFSRPSGLFIDKQDNIFVADSESESVARNHNGWKRGIRIGNVKDMKVTAFIPDPVDKSLSTSAAEGVAADPKGNIYGAEVGPRAVKKYILR